jgi:hypothetical protein
LGRVLSTDGPEDKKVWMFNPREFSTNYPMNVNFTIMSMRNLR